MKIAEATYTIDKRGGLRIPAAALSDMGLTAGDPVRVAYLTSDGNYNDFREFLIANLENDESTAVTDQQISIPAHILMEANIPPEADIQIACLNGCIAIYRDSALTVEELAALSLHLETANAFVGQVSDNFDLAEIAEQLKASVERATEGGKENDCGV